MILGDVLQPGLAVVFCGTQAGRVSAERRAYYAGPGNRFWRTLYGVELTPVLLRPEEFRRLPEFGIGLTDVAKLTYGSDSTLRKDHFDVLGFWSRIAAVHPRSVAFNGKKAASEALSIASARLGYGRHSERGGIEIYVLPSTSGAASGFWSLAPWRQLADACRQVDA